MHIFTSSSNITYSSVNLSSKFTEISIIIVLSHPDKDQTWHLII